MDFSLFFGIEPENYYPAMSGIEIVQGRLLKPGEDGMMLSYNTWKNFKDKKNIVVKVGDSIQLNNFGTGGFKIRDVPVVGIFKFPRGNSRLWPMSFIDAKSLRYLLGRVSGTAEKVVVPKAATSLLDANIDSLFGADSVGTVAATTGQVDSKNVFNILGGTKAAPKADDNETSWHFVLIRMDKGANIPETIKKLNNEFEDQGLLARAQNWWISAMPDSLTYSGLQILFNVAIFILAFVAIIIIMNTMVVSVMERTSEIGTMRALGAQKSFVTKMFITETGFITLVFGGLGLALGGLIILALNVVGIPTDNDALRYLGGGGVLRPTIGIRPLVVSLVLMGIIGLFSWIYPVLIALKVSPLKAIATE
jgi:putative ABC transport system permease protein